MKFISCKRTKKIIIAILIFLCVIFVLKLVVDNRIMLARLTPTNVTVTTEQLDKDIDTILSVYGLKKSNGEILQGEGNGIYDTYYKKTDSKGKSIFIEVNPILYGSSRDYTEIKTLMEIWLYVNDRKFDYDIDGITYYFTAPAKSFALLRANEIYMSRDEFLLLYNELDVDGLKHTKQIELLSDAYVEKYNYERGPGHIQVECQ